MTRGTTPTITVLLPDTVDMTQAHNIYATVVQGFAKIRKTGEDLTRDAHAVSFSLTQEETLSFAAGSKAKIQLNWVYDDERRGCTKIVELPVSDNLEKEVLA